MGVIPKKMKGYGKITQWYNMISYKFFFFLVENPYTLLTWWITSWQSIWYLVSQEYSITVCSQSQTWMFSLICFLVINLLLYYGWVWIRVCCVHFVAIRVSVFFFFFFFENGHCGSRGEREEHFFTFLVGLMHCSQDPQVLY